MLKSHRTSDAVKQAIMRARHLAVARQSASVETAHLFMGILQVESEQPSLVSSLLEVSGVSVEEARLYALSAIQTTGQPKGGKPLRSTSANRVLAMALEEADKLGAARVGLEHLLLACVRHQSEAHVGEVLRPLGLDAEVLRSCLRNWDRERSPGASGTPLAALSEGAKQAVEAAHAVMRASFCGRISTAHLLLGLLADRENTAVETLLAANVDVDALAKEVRDLIVNDGEIATPQKKFSAAAKRALERAQLEANLCDHSWISPQHLLFALLPQPSSWSERLAFGSSVVDPLERLWVNWPVEEIKLQYEKMWQPEELEDEAAPSPIPPSYIRINWRWFPLGFLWWIWTLVPTIGPWLLALGFGASIVVAIGASIVKDNGLRDMAASFCSGVVCGLILLPYLLSR